MSRTETTKRPTHYLYAVTKHSTEAKGYWTRIGAAWPNSDGKGFSFKLDLVPLNGADIVMREPKEEGESQ